MSSTTTEQAPALKKLKINEEIQKLLPPLSEAEYRGLEADILKNGCLMAIVTWNDTIVDGHNRYEICQKHGLPFETTSMEFPSLNEAKFWAWQHQIHRRNLSQYQCVELALQIKPIVAERIREKEHLRKTTGQKSGQSTSESLRTDEVIAQITNVSKDTVSRVDYLVKNADEETKEQLRQKKTSINKEYKRLKTEEKSKQQSDVIVESSIQQVSAVIDEAESETTGRELENSGSPKNAPSLEDGESDVVRTTLKDIRQDHPRHLLQTLSTDFRKGYIEDLAIEGMAFLHKEHGKRVTIPIAKEIAGRYLEWIDPDGVQKESEESPMSKTEASQMLESKERTCIEEIPPACSITTLKNIRQNHPDHLLRSLASHFRKRFIEDLVLDAMAFLHEKHGEEVTTPIAEEIVKRYFQEDVPALEMLYPLPNETLFDADRGLQNQRITVDFAPVQDPSEQISKSVYYHVGPEYLEQITLPSMDYFYQIKGKEGMAAYLISLIQRYELDQEIKKAKF